MRTSGLMLAALSLTACAPYRFVAPPPQVCQAPAPDDILGQWTLERIDGQAWRGAEITLAAEETALWGQLSCNGYGTAAGEGDRPEHYLIDDGRLVLNGDIVLTAKLCEDPAQMELEEQMVDLLYGSPMVSRNGDVMCLFTEDGMALEFRAADPAAAN